MSVKITIIEGGPAIVHSSKELIYIESNSPKGTEPINMTKKIAICRCGKSAKGIVCDGSHAKKGDEFPNSSL